MKPIKQSMLFDSLANMMSGVSAKGEAQKISAPARAVKPATQKLRILLAEDNKVNQQVALGLLRKLGHQADAVVDGAEALAAL